jgi:hypothetical protein
MKKEKARDDDKASILLNPLSSSAAQQEGRPIVTKSF